MMQVIGRSLLLFVLFFDVPAVAHHKPEKLHDEAPISVKSKRDAAFEKQNKKIARAYKEYKKKVARVWGGEAIVPDAGRDVTYRDNLKQRSVVDYAEGVVKVEVAVRFYSAEQRDAAIRKLEQAIERTILQGPDDRSIIDIAKNPEPPETHSPAVLAKLIANADGSPFKAGDLQDFKAAKSRDMQIRPLTGKDGKERIVISTQFKMVPNHIRVRAEKFQDSVDRYSQEHKIPAPMIYAIIETESSFNPRARSPIPAFGLMQLVPGRAARDAYKFLNSKDRIVKERYLYVADKNIELGTAYLHILYYRYFKAIKDPESRQWATIAAYNAGARNVIKSFSGKYSKKKYTSSYSWKKYAFNKINKMDSKRVYQHLRRHMPAGETRRYIKKVRSRMTKYST